jgi:predicted metallo-beta-lactamase superfamily hydrolase
MSRKIKIKKYEGNTHFSVIVVDKYNQEHHLGLFKHIYTNQIEAEAQLIWANETKRKVNSMSEIIGKMHKMAVDSGLYQGNRDGLD